MLIAILVIRFVVTLQMGRNKASIPQEDQRHRGIPASNHRKELPLKVTLAPKIDNV
jgi:hypothetical protein